MDEVDTSLVDTIKALEELNKSKERERRRPMPLSFVSSQHNSAT